MLAWYPETDILLPAQREKEAFDEEKVSKVKEVIERFPSYGYRRIAAVLGWNRKVVQRICQRKGWQVKKRIKGKRPRARGLISVASRPNERWSTDLTGFYVEETDGARDGN